MGGIPNSSFLIPNSKGGGQVFAWVLLVEIRDAARGFFAGRRHDLGNHDLNGGEMVAMGAGLGVPYALAAQPEGTPGVGPGRNLGPHRTVHSSDLDFTTPVSLGESDRNRGVDVIADSLEEPVRADANPHEEVPGIAS